MNKTTADNNDSGVIDEITLRIADYVFDETAPSQLALTTAHYAIWDALGCALLALHFPECRKLLGPFMFAEENNGYSRVPGTRYSLDPITAAFNITTMIRWLDFNDTWLAKEWGHPSDNLGAILAVADHLDNFGEDLTMLDVLHAMIKCYEIQGVLALSNSFNEVGIDHVVLVKLASTAVVTRLLGGSHEDVLNAITHVWVDGQSLRTYRHAPNTGSRKSWAAGDAASRAVRLASICIKGEPGYPTALSADKWGLQSVLFSGKPLTLSRALHCYVMENILFKVAYPAEFHAQTAVECAIQLHKKYQSRLQDIKSVHITTQEPAIRIISKHGPLHNPADRDHCLQYMVAVALLKGNLTAEDYEDNVAANPEIDALREKMIVSESQAFTRDYYDESKRSIANACQLEFANGERSEAVEIVFPLGHRHRRSEGLTYLKEKLQQNMQRCLSKRQAESLWLLFENPDAFQAHSVSAFMELLQLP